MKLYEFNENKFPVYAVIYANNEAEAYRYKDFPEVRRKLWKEMFWSRSYCLLTTGGAPIETIRKYIENQSR